MEAQVQAVRSNGRRPLAFLVLARGLIDVAPGRARVIQLFGRYRGTVRARS